MGVISSKLGDLGVVTTTLDTTIELGADGRDVAPAVRVGVLRYRNDGDPGF